jgi:acyl-CoA thioester hydrolase
MHMTPDALFRSSRLAIEPEWIDYNGHLNMAYYMVLFDRGGDEFSMSVGLGPEYAATRRLTTYTAEAHIAYVRELHLADPVIATMQLLDHDAKRMHTYQELRHADEGWLAATCETMTLHVDMSGPKVVPFPPDIAARLAEIAAAQSALPWPERAGRRIGIKRA